MEDLVQLFVEAIRLRMQGEVAQARQKFDQFDEQAIKLGISPQHAIVRHILFEADTSSIEEIWKSSVGVIEETLAQYTTAGQMMGRLETLVSLTQVHIYLKQADKASPRLEEARALLQRFAQGELPEAMPFPGWETFILVAKRQQLENLSQQIAALTAAERE